MKSLLLVAYVFLSVINVSTANQGTMEAESSVLSQIIPPKECGNSLGCYDDCTPNCTFLITWQQEDDSVRFQLQSYQSGDTWMAIGLSKDTGMGDSSVSECVVYGGVVKAFQSYNEDSYENNRRPNPELGLRNISGVVSDGLFTCSFLRQGVVEGDDKIFNLTHNWFLLFARGKANSDFSKEFHDFHDASQKALDFHFEPLEPNITTTSPASTTASPGKIAPPEGCKVSVGCFDDCGDSSCSFVVTWREEGDHVQFNLQTHSQDDFYMAIAFSPDDMMGNDSVSECVVYNNTYKVQQTWNTAEFTNEQINDPELGLSNTSASVVDGVFTCSFMREKTVVGDPKVFNLTEKWYIFFARGPATEGFIIHHHIHAAKSQNMLDFEKLADVTVPPVTTQSTSTPSSSTTMSPGKIAPPEGCKVSVGCFDDCGDSSCSFLVTWREEGYNVQFNLQTHSEDDFYMAIAFSADDMMGNDSVSECVVYNDTFRVQQTWNTPEFTNEQIDDPELGLSNTSASVVDGVFTCSFMREKTVVGDPKVFNLTEKWYIFFARGPATKGFIIHHHRYAAKSQNMLDFEKLADVTVPPLTSPSTPAQSTASTTPDSSGISRSKECGKTLGCFDDCQSGCTFTITWTKVDDDNLRFHLRSFSIGNSWMAIGLSATRVMGNAGVVECVDNGGTVRVFQSENPPGYSNKRLDNPEQGLSETQGSIVDGVFDCSFTREYGVSSDDQYFNLTHKWYLMFAVGNAKPNFVKIPHTKTPKVSANMINFTRFESEGSGKIKYTLVQIHGSLMSIAWLMLASIGLIMARYYKLLWPDSTIRDVKVWFWVHRTCLSLTFLLTIVAFIIIFVESQGYSQINGELYKKAHPVLGIIVTVLVFINPIMASFRPGPKDEKRPMFNWAHFIVGTGAYIIAVITIFFGMELGKSGAPDYMKYILAGYCGWQVCLEFSLELMECVAKNRETRDFDDVKMQSSMALSDDPATRHLPSILQPQYVYQKKCLLALHLLVVTGVTITVIALLI